MKIAITGSLGHISLPLTKELIQKELDVIVISRNASKKGQIEELGATAAIGSVEDTEFLTKTFTGVDAVYTMLPPPDFSNPNLNFSDRANKIASNYVQAIQESGVKHVVHLSSVGAHTNQGNGLLLWAYNIEKRLSELPSSVDITFLRPVSFYYNLLGFISGIKAQSVIASNYGAEDIIPWVSPVDIAAVAVEELVVTGESRKIRYIASDELSCNETARILGEAIGKPNLKWIFISDEQLLNGMIAFGLNESLAKGFVEMNSAMHDGSLFENYYRNKPTFGKVKMTDYAREFAAVHNE